MTTLTAPPRQPSRTALREVAEVRWAGIAVALFLLGLAAQVTGSPAPVWWALYLACYAAGGWEPARAGVQALARRRLDVDLLMVLAALGAAAIGQVLDGALLIVIFATSGALEAVATRRTEESVRSLLDLAPEEAVRTDADGETRLPVEELAPGDEILVRPGERIGADGHVVDGAGEVDQSTVTGEPLPVEKACGDEVFAGTLNGTGALRIRVSRPAHESVVARIAALVDEAGTTKAQAQLWIERVEQRYSVAMVAATVVLFVVPLVLGADLRDALLRAMTFMIVASPCALVLATMPPMLAAIANAGRHGVLIKSAVALERLATVRQVALDKTGTLTEAATELAAVQPIGGCEDALGLAAGVEQGSEHPVARAVVTAARRQGVDIPAAQDFRAFPGQGVEARVAGRTVRVGSPASITDPRVIRHVQDAEEQGRTAVVVTVDDEPAAVLAVSDRIRPGAAAAVAALTELTGRAPVMLTGDAARSAAPVAAAVGITEIHASLLPHEKVSATRVLTGERGPVLLVGDGLNDAPAMAAAHTGVAMGRSGADISLDTADVVIVHDDLAAVPAAVALARRARRVVAANLAVAGACIAGLVTWDLAGDLPLPLGVAGHEGSTILVALNGLRLLRRFG